MVADFKQKQKKERIVRILFALGGILTVLIALLLVAADVNVYYKKRALNRQVADLENKIKEMERENEELEQGIAESDNEAYIEKIAREDLNLKKPGEKVVSFIMPQESEKQEAEHQKTFLQEWFAWLGGGWQWMQEKF